MRAFHLCLFLAVGAMAQQKDVSFRNVLGGSFAGFSEDEKSEKIWEATAVVMRPAAEAGVWDMEMIKVQSLRGGKPWAVFTSPNGTMIPARRAGVLVVTHLQRPGGKMLPAGEFLAGYPLAVGEVLASAEMPAFVSDRPFPRAPKA